MIYFIVILAAFSRLITHVPNFAPITALAIFSAANLNWKKSAAITLLARFISDIFLGFFSWPLMLAVYASHLAGILFGLWIKKHQGKLWTRATVSSLGASVLFFLVTNFAFLYPSYSHNLSGIMESYVNALPFFKGTLLGDLSYTLALFGAYELSVYASKFKKARILAPGN